jgi:hypothetical protein
MDEPDQPIPQLNDLIGSTGIPSHLLGDLQNLRICLQYMMLDLESTRRENQTLRQIIQELDPEG